MKERRTEKKRAISRDKKKERERGREKKERERGYKKQCGAKDSRDLLIKHLSQKIENRTKITIRPKSGPKRKDWNQTGF